MFVTKEDVVVPLPAQRPPLKTLSVIKRHRRVNGAPVMVELLG